MDREAISSRVVEIMREVFDNDDIQYRDDLTAEQVEGWDSLSHIRLMVAVEKEFGVRFTGAEMEQLANLGALVDLLERKRG